jgi:N-acetylneuraminic acid mutarotase
MSLPKRLLTATLTSGLLVSLALSATRAQTPPDAPDVSPASAESASRAGSWISLAPLPEPAAGLAGAAVNGKLYVFGGRDGTALNGPRSKGLVYEYDTATDVWARKKPLPVAIHHPAIAAYGDKIYLFGGFRTPARSGGWQPVDNAWEYDPAADDWKPLPPMPKPRGGAAAAVIDGKFYVIGGVAAVSAPAPDESGAAPTIDDKRRHDVLASVAEYDLKAGTWRARAPMPTPRSQPTAVAKLGRIYVIGGRLGSAFAAGSDIDIVEAYDPAADRWSAPLAPLPTARSSAGAALWRNLIVVAGGSTHAHVAPAEKTSNRASPTAEAAVEAYDTIADRWFRLVPLPQPLTGFAADIVGDRFHAVGGATPREQIKPGDTASHDAPDRAADMAPSSLAQALELDARSLTRSK